MSSIAYVSGVANSLTRKYDTRDPHRLCDELGVRIRYKDLGKDIKAYYFYQSRIRNIVVNNRISEPIQRILIAHELGHDRLHQEIAMLKGFQELEMFSMATPTEFEANIFAAELLIDDSALLELLNNEHASFFSAAKELHVPAALLDFKFRVLKRKGFRLEAPIIAQGDFLKNDIDGCFDEDDY